MTQAEKVSQVGSGKSSNSSESSLYRVKQKKIF